MDIKYLLSRICIKQIINKKFNSVFFKTIFETSNGLDGIECSEKKMEKFSI